MGISALPLPVVLPCRECHVHQVSDIKIGAMGVKDWVDFFNIRFPVRNTGGIGMDLNNFPDVEQVAPAINGPEHGAFNIDRTLFCHRSGLQFPKK